MKVSIPNKIRKAISLHNKYRDVEISKGLSAHVMKRHPSCVKYISQLPKMIQTADYIGINPNEAGFSFELVKLCDNNIMIGIKLNVKKDYLYVASVYDITNAKLNKRIASKRLQKL